MSMCDKRELIKTKEKASMQKPITVKRVIVVGLIAIALLPIVYLTVRAVLFASSRNELPTTDLDNYRNEELSGWICDDPYAVFPDEDLISQADNWDYLYKREYSLLPLLFDNEIVCYLKCNYQPQDYSKEVQRLSSLCGDSNTKNYTLPAYVYYAGRCRQYALTDNKSNTIYYIAYQIRGFAERYIDSTLLPQYSFA